ncbi:MAG: hypothetical protein ACRDFS_13745 [Chloroflexota bacterium]
MGGRTGALGGVEHGQAVPVPMARVAAAWQCSGRMEILSADGPVHGRADIGGRTSADGHRRTDIGGHSGVSRSRRDEPQATLHWSRRVEAFVISSLRQFVTGLVNDQFKTVEQKLCAFASLLPQVRLTILGGRRTLTASLWW